MDQDTPFSGRGKMLLVVLGVIVVVLGTFLLIGILAGDDTDEIDPQNGDSAPVLLH